MSDKIISSGKSHFAGDEGVINVLLWIKNANKSYMEICDLNYQDFEIKLKNISDGTGSETESLLYYVSHGCKSFDRAIAIYNGIKQRGGVL